MTYWESDGGDDRSLYISPYSADLNGVKRFPVAKSTGKMLSRPEDMIDAFNTHGTEILNDSGRRDLIIMDELGFMESKADTFKLAVMRHISGKIPVLGVIKPKKTEFLDAIRAMDDVEVLEVTVENRDEILKTLLNRSW